MTPTNLERLDACQIHAAGKLLDAMRALDRGNAQIAFVVDDRARVLGTITDGDVRRALLGGATVETRLEGHFERHFIHVDQAAGRAAVLELMQARAVAQIPVLDESGRLVGLHLLHEMLGRVERPNWAVIMAGGKGTRLRPLTEHVPKSMIPVAGRPILERLVLHLVGYGIRSVYLAVNYLAPAIEEHFGDGRKLGCEIHYLREREELPLGTAGALSLLPTVPTHPLMVLNGDLVAQFDVESMLAFHEAGRFSATLAVTEYTHTVPLGVVDADGDRITALREKPTVAFRTNAGIYVIEPGLVGRVPRDTEFTMPALVEDCLRRNEPVGAFPVEGSWIDVGRTKELQRARGEIEHS